MKFTKLALVLFAAASIAPSSSYASASIIAVLQITGIAINNSGGNIITVYGTDNAQTTILHIPYADIVSNVRLNECYSLMKQALTSSKALEVIINGTGTLPSANNTYTFELSDVSACSLSSKLSSEL